MQRTSSPPALVCQPVDVRYAPSARPVLRQTAKWLDRQERRDSLDAVNDRMNADWENVLRMAKLNTIRLTGKPTL